MRFIIRRKLYQQDQSTIRPTHKRMRAALWALGLCALVTSAFNLPVSVQASASAPSGNSFADWHLPIPAGEWVISRGPCGSAALFDHECLYYENRCAVDLVPVAGSMQNVPVLAPQAGRVFFLGPRSETGLFLMLLHPEGYVSGYMHLAQTAVGLDEEVAQGQVIGYAGQSGTARPHLHFFVQPNAVERLCVMPDGIDGLDYRHGRAVSRNLAWPALALPNPPALPDWLPMLALTATAQVIVPREVTLAPGASASVPILARGNFTSTDALSVGGALIAPVRKTVSYALFAVPLTAAQKPGEYRQSLELRVGSQRRTTMLSYRVETAAAGRNVDGVLLVNPELVSPTGWSYHKTPPQVCWRVPANDGQPPLKYRLIAAGPTLVDSGWITGTCWQMPTLDRGPYLWKAFVRDARGYMNRTNQRPFAFIIR